MNALNFQFRRRGSTGLPDAPRRGGQLRLGDVLIRDGALRPDQVADALAIQRYQDAPLGEIMALNGMLSSNAVTRALARKSGTSAVDLDLNPPDPRIADRLNAEFCVTHMIIPWRINGAVTVIACADLSSAALIRRQLPAAIGTVRFVVADKQALQRALHRIFSAPLAAASETRTAAIDSCRNWSGNAMVGVLSVLFGVSAVLAFGAPALLASSMFWIAVGTLLVNTTLKACCIFIAVSRKKAVTSMFCHSPHRPRAKLPKISILVPLFKEANIAAKLINRLGKIDYPRALLELCLVVEADDAVTRKAVRSTKLPDGMKVITVPRGTIKTKPRAMNYALDFTSGSIIGVYDAEDAPDRDQLSRVAARFASAPEDLACIQGILSFYNPRAGWLARCFSFEYAGWFRVMLPGLQRLGFAIPLGGTTLFFRRDALLKLGGWDAHNVTEDADLGMRLARHGYRCEMLDTVTGEEANNRLWPWVRQRSRWLKGYAMTYCVHMRRPLVLLRDLGVWKFVGFQILFLGTLLAFCLAPILWWTFAHFISGGYVPAVAGLDTGDMYSLSMLFMACEAVTMSLFFVAGQKLENRPSMAWILTLPAYFTLGTVAAYKGVVEMAWKPFFWDKTEHGVSIGDVGSGVGGGVDLQSRLVGNGQVISQSS